MSAQESTRYPLTVLVVDDDPDTAASVAELLAIHGHAARVALDGEEALRLVAERLPDVVLLDIRMPHLDGCAVARLIRQRCESGGKRPLLVAVTGCASDADRERTELAGFDLHMVKPVAPPLLVGVLERFRRLLAPTSAAPPDAPRGEPDDWPELTDRAAAL